MSGQTDTIFRFDDHAFPALISDRICNLSTSNRIEMHNNAVKYLFFFSSSLRLPLLLCHSPAHDLYLVATAVDLLSSSSLVLVDFHSHTSGAFKSPQCLHPPLLFINYAAIVLRLRHETVGRAQFDASQAIRRPTELNQIEMNANKDHSSALTAPAALSFLCPSPLLCSRHCSTDIQSVRAVQKSPFASPIAPSHQSNRSVTSVLNCFAGPALVVARIKVDQLDLI
jgi:hypothetical protein